MNNETVIDKGLKKAMDEMMELYNCGKIEELSKIVDSPNEPDDRVAAAAMVLQMPRDPRRI